MRGVERGCVFSHNRAFRVKRIAATPARAAASSGICGNRVDPPRTLAVYHALPSGPPAATRRSPHRTSPLAIRPSGDRMSHNSRQPAPLRVDSAPGLHRSSLEARIVAAVMLLLALLSESGLAQTSTPQFPAARPQSSINSVAAADDQSPHRVAPAKQRTPIRRADDGGGARSTSRAASSPWGTLVLLGGIVAVILLGAKWMKQAAPDRFARLAPAAIDLLGTRSITPQHGMHIVRVGERLLVLGSGSDGLRTLSEITEPAEVAHLTHLCRDDAARLDSGWSLNALMQTLSRRPASIDQRDGTCEESSPSTSRSSRSPDAAHQGDSSGLLRSREGPHVTRVASWLIVFATTTTIASAQVAPRPTRPLQLAPTEASRLRTAAPQHGTPVAPAPASPQGGASSRLLPTWNGPPPTSAIPNWSGDAAVRSIDQHRRLITATAPASTHLVARVGHETTGPSPEANSEQHQHGATDSTESPAQLAAELASPEGFGQTIKLGLLIGVVSLAPAILLMTTCYVRIVVVLGLLRQAIGVQQFPPTQVLTALSLFLTALVMWPTWQRCYSEGVRPYAESDSTASAGNAEFQLAVTRTAAPLRSFMSRQIEATGNTDAVDLLMHYQAASESTKPSTPQFYEEVPLQALLPAYVLSELKTAFLIGFQIYLPFVVIDLVVTSVLTSLGLGMLPPSVASLPFKLLLFVLIDGWFLTVELLLQSLPPVG